MSGNTNNTIEKLSKRLKYYKFWSVILVVLVLIIVFNAQRSETSVGKFPLLDPARVFFDQDNYLLNIQELRTYLHELEAKYPDSLSVYYEQINSGSNISVNRDLRLFPASLSKLVQAIIIARKIEEGTLSWDKRLATRPEDLSSDSGELYKTIGDKSLTVEELMKELLVNSDNTAQNIFRRNLDVEDYLKFQDQTGLLDLYNEKGFISAKEYTRILRVLYTSSYLDPEHSEKILRYMSEATFRNYLSQGVPSDVVFAHKYGENLEQFIFADSGIVYVPGRPYMITVMIKGKDFSDETRVWAQNLMKEISTFAYMVSN